jgi:hypothetical protein
MMAKFVKITDYEKHRLRIVPTNFTTANTPFMDHPIEVVYADVTVLNVLDKPQDLGNVAIFQRQVIGQIKATWDGRPIVGTLVRREIPGRGRGYPPAYILDDLEVE